MKEVKAPIRIPHPKEKSSRRFLRTQGRKNLISLVPYKSDRVGRLMWDTPLYIMSLKALVLMFSLLKTDVYPLKQMISWGR